MFYFYKEEPQFAMEHFLPFQPQPPRRRQCRRSQLMPSCQPMVVRRIPHQVDIFEQLMNEAEKRVCAEQRNFGSVRDYWEAIETVAKAMMDALEKEDTTEKAVEEKKSEERKMSSNKSMKHLFSPRFQKTNLWNLWSLWPRKKPKSRGLDPKSMSMRIWKKWRLSLS